MINLNEDFGDGEQFSWQIRLSIEMLLIILEEIEGQRKFLHAQQGKLLSGSAL